jgi:hypothetical protein
VYTSPSAQQENGSHFSGTCKVDDWKVTDAEVRLELLLLMLFVCFNVAKIPRLIEKYNLPEYTNITAAVQRGDLALFNQSFVQWEALFRKRGLYLLLERLKWLVYRKLFKVLEIIWWFFFETLTKRIYPTPLILCSVLTRWSYKAQVQFVPLMYCSAPWHLVV